MKNVILSVAMCAGTLMGFAQDDLFSKPSLHIDGCLPMNTGNPAFRATMDGVAWASVWGQMRVIPSVFAGIGVASYYGSVNDVALGINILTRGSVLSWAPFARLGYEKTLNEQFQAVGYARGGYMFSSWSSAYLAGTKYKQEMPFAEAGFGVRVKAQAHIAVSIMAGYTMMFGTYGPPNIGLTQFSGFSSDSYEGALQFFHVGIGFGFYLGGPKGGSFGPLD
jgi:hypothetical protein